MIKIECTDEQKDLIRSLLLDEKVKQETRRVVGESALKYAQKHGMPIDTIASVEEKTAQAKQDLEDLEDLFRMFK